MTASFVSNPGRQYRRQKTAQRQPQIKSDELKPSFHTATGWSGQSIRFRSMSASPPQGVW